jgi:hypothetical protein
MLFQTPSLKSLKKSNRGLIMSDNTYEKDYMGVITWGRLQCGAPQPMFGSEIKTDSPVYIRISELPTP